MSISLRPVAQVAPVTGCEPHAFVPVRPRTARTADGIVATVGDAADETVTSEGRCPR